MRRSVVAGLVSVLLAVLVTTACGDDGDGAGTETVGAPPVSLAGAVSDRGTADLGGGTTIEVELGDTYFGPTYVTTAGRRTVTVSLRNEGKLPHTFTIDGTSVDRELAPGASGAVEVALPASGSLRFYCRFHVEGGMQGAFALS